MVALYNISRLARNGKLLEMSLEWVASIVDPVLKKCAEECIRQDPKERAEISHILNMLTAAESFDKNETPEAIFSAANKLCSKNQFISAAELYKLAADKGYPEALVNLANMY